MSGHDDKVARRRIAPVGRPLPRVYRLEDLPPDELDTLRERLRQLGPTPPVTVIRRERARWWRSVLAVWAFGAGLSCLALAALAFAVFA